MVRRIFSCRKIFPVVGLVFLVMGIVQIIAEVEAGLFSFVDSHGFVMVVVGVGLLVFSTMRVLTGKVDDTSSCLF